MYTRFSQDAVLSFTKGSSNFCHDVISVQPPPEEGSRGLGLD